MALDEIAKYIVDANVRASVRTAILEGVRTSVAQLGTAGIGSGSAAIEMAYRRPAMSMRVGRSLSTLRRFGMA